MISPLNVRVREQHSSTKALFLCPSTKTTRPPACRAKFSEKKSINLEGSHTCQSEGLHPILNISTLFMVDVKSPLLKTQKCLWALNYSNQDSSNFFKKYSIQISKYNRIFGKVFLKEAKMEFNLTWKAWQFLASVFQCQQFSINCWHAVPKDLQNK